MQTCIDAFKNLNISTQRNTLQISPCCLVPTRQVDTIDFVNNLHLNRTRQFWQSGEFAPGCFACKQIEQNNGRSRRQNSNAWYQEQGHNDTTVELIRIDYWTGDTCNLRCAICTPENSSAWKEELKYTARPITKEAAVNRIWKELNLSKLEFVHFNGGEPLLNKEHIIFLKEIPIKNRVVINYNTNGTIRPSRELLDLWAEFKLIQIDFSIDDVGERFEYQRYPAKWNEVTENLQWFVDTCPTNCMFAVNTSVGVLNYSNLANLSLWVTTNFNKNRVSDPIEHRQQLVNGLFALENYASNSNNIIKFLDDCDARRGTHWRYTFPELANTV
jgi:sulfatase maturation enzyme AslB (radical SAM superfamily)